MAMGNTTTLIKRFRQTFLLLLLCCASCKSNNSWTFDRVESGSSNFNSTRMTFPSPDPINGIDVELLRTSNRLYAYLNVHSLPIPQLNNHPKHAFVYFLIGEEKHRFEALCREGGQRLLLPDEATTLLISAMQKQQTIDIKVSGYAAQVTPSGFSTYYSKMVHSPLFPNPFHLPL